MDHTKRARAWLIVLALLWIALLGGAAAWAVRSLTAPQPPAFHAEEQARAGLITYAQHCASCHGPDLEGVSAPALVGEEFLAGWSGRSAGELLDYVHDEMPQGRGGTLSDLAYERATAYVLARNGFPAGGTPLRLGAARLDDLQLDPAYAGVPNELPDVDSADGAAAAEGEEAPAENAAVAGVAEPVAEPSAAPPARLLGSAPVYLAQAQGQGDEPDSGAPTDGAAAGEDGGAGAAEDGGSGDGSVDGAAVYEANCASCHGAEGGGGAGPALAGNEAVEDARGVIVQIVHGGQGMPPFGDQLSDARIAAVASHVRTSWGNGFGAVSEEQVAEAQNGNGQEGRQDEGANGGGQAGEGAAGAAEGGGPDGGGEGAGGAEIDGAAVYDANCVHCHGAEGGGGVGPALAGNEDLQGAEAVVRQILRGGDGMPAFAETLSRAEVAAVATHVRTAWGNDFGSVEPAAVPDGEGGGEAGADDGGGAGGDVGADGRVEASVVPDQGAVTADVEVQGPPAGEGDAELVEAFGSRLYGRHCAACHGAEGTGGIGPPLVGNPRLADAAWTVRRILVGGNAMPAFGAVLSAEGVAAVTTYVRTRWGDEGAVGPEDVSAVADGLTLQQLNPVAALDLDDAPLGQQRYMQVCAACHGTQGGGDVGPPLAGNANLENTQLVMTTILHGRGLMPAFAHHSDEELAAVASYVRTAWSNAFGAIGPAEVRPFRQPAGTGSAGPGAAAGEGRGGGEDRQNADPQTGRQDEGQGASQDDGSRGGSEASPGAAPRDDATTPSDEENP